MRFSGEETLLINPLSHFTGLTISESSRDRIKISFTAQNASSSLFAPFVLFHVPFETIKGAGSPMVAGHTFGAELKDRWLGVARHLRARARSGSATLEFAMIAPVFFLFLMGIIETGVIFFGNSTLQFAADDLSRQIRTGQVQSQNLTAAQFRTKVCNDIGPLLPCNANLQIDVETFNSFGGASMTPPLTAQGNLNPNLDNFNPGSACQVAVVRLFYTWHIITPLMQPLLGNLPGGYHLLTASGAFRNEPFSGTSC